MSARVTIARPVGSSRQFTDRVFGYRLERPAHSVLSTIKRRQAGFTSCEDTEDSLDYRLCRMQAGRLLPR